MTCVVGIVDENGSVWIGADSAGVDQYYLEVRADEKVFTRKSSNDIEWAFGFTTSFRMGQLLRYQLKLPDLTEEDKDDLYRFLIDKFIPTLRKCLSQGGFQEKQHGRESGGTFMIGLMGCLFVVRDDYQVAKTTHSYMVVGSGSAPALGAMFVMERDLNCMRTSEEKITLALQAAEECSPYVRGPYNIVVARNKPFCSPA